LSLPWDESTRPAGPAPDPGRELTAEELATGQHLADVHDGLRSELERLRRVVDEVGEGEADPAALRSFFNRMTIRQNHWTLGPFCQSYCRAVTGHHTLEDSSVLSWLSRLPGSVSTRWILPDYSEDLCTKLLEGNRER
jgi:hypothetical protein